jgi:hypothetical protein
MPSQAFKEEQPSIAGIPPSRRTHAPPGGGNVDGAFVSVRDRFGSTDRTKS